MQRTELEKVLSADKGDNICWGKKRWNLNCVLKRGERVNRKEAPLLEWVHGRKRLVEGMDRTVL